MDGQFQTTVEDGLVTIDAYPGSSVTVTDAGAPVAPGPHPAARVDVEEFDFNVSSPYTEVDLAQNQGGRVDDLAYDHVTGVLSPINGAMVADIKKYAATSGNGLPSMNLPDENDCAQIKSSSWQSSFSAENLEADMILSCIVTAEKDFGFLVIGRDRNTRPVSYYVYSYAWVR